MDQIENINFQEENIDIKVVLVKFWRYWPLFLLTIMLALMLAFAFNKYTPPIYQVSATVLIEEDKGNMNAQDLLGFGIMGNNKNLENEIGLLKSYSLAYKTIEKLDFYVSYYYKENMITKELYQNAPIIVEFDDDYPQLIRTKFSIEILSDEEYRIVFAAKKSSTYDFLKHKRIQQNLDLSYSEIHHFDEMISNPYFKFKVSINPAYASGIKNYDDLSFILNDIDYLIEEFGDFSIEPINREASIVKLTLKGNVIQKSVNFLNQLTQQYIDCGLNDKNEVAINTIDFITNELLGIADSLNVTEGDLQDFRSNNQIMDIDFQSQKIFEFMKELEQEKAVLVVKSKYYKNLKEYLGAKNSVDDIVVPSSIGIEDPLLNTLVTEMIQLFNSRSELLFSSTEKNPLVLSLDKQILNTKNALTENINNIVNTSNIAIQDIDQRINALSKKIDYLPKTQRELFSLERKFKLNDAIYTYLLQKLSEAQITKASNRPDNKIIDSAKTSQYLQVFPKGKLNYIIAFILGCILPIIYVLAKDYLNDKIIERKDVEDRTKLPIVGHVTHNTKTTELVVVNNPKSSITESFRSIRTNVQFLSKGKEKQIIMVTSDIVGTGKTFVSMNLASIYALYEKKTVLLGFDLRKPKIFKNFKLNNTVGLSTYYIQKNSIQEIIQKTKFDNLDIIMAGPIPPNPAELIASAKTKTLFEELLKRYDYIIIDTPPLGLVTDAFLLLEHTDVNLFIVRQHFTIKKVFESIIRDIEEKKIPNFSILINDVKLEKGSYGYGYGYGYGNGYGYGYGYGYYEDDHLKKRRSFFRRLFSLSK